MRYGVAPDHQSIKGIAKALQRVLENHKVRFLGGLELGRDLTADDLTEAYDAVVLATGAPRSAGLGIPGAKLPGSLTAAEFVGWYSGHPDVAQPHDLAARSVGVVGAGNVALDIARLLVKDAEDLADTDIPDSVLWVLRQSTVRDVHIFCRRGPADCKFTARELAELLSLDDIDIAIDPTTLEQDTGVEISRAAEENLSIFRELADHRVEAPRRRLHLHFWSRPVEILGIERVESVQIETTQTGTDGRLVGTGQVSELPIDVIVGAVGFRGTRIPGVPFDESTGTIPNDAGRVRQLDGSPIDGLYVAGWAKRGPSGVVGTNRADAAETVRTLLLDLAQRDEPQGPRSDPHFLGNAIGYDGWIRIDEAELSRGASVGRPRVKIADWHTLRELSRADNGRGEAE